MLDALIIAPEITKGMKSLGSKALLTIKNSISILDYQIQELKKIDKNIFIYIATGFESDKVEKTARKYSNTKIIENNKYETSNQTKCLSLFIEQYSNINSLLIISNGVLFKNKAISPDKNDQRAKIFIIDKPKANFTIGCNNISPTQYLFYDLPITWSECVLFNQDCINAFKTMAFTQNTDQLYLFEVINLMIEKYNITFTPSVLAKKNIMKINTIKDLSRAKLFI